MPRSVQSNEEVRTCNQVTILQSNMTHKRIAIKKSQKLWMYKEGKRENNFSVYS